MVIPFLSLYIESFGNYPDDKVQFWSGITFGITFVHRIFFFPIWGRIGNRYGKRIFFILSAASIGFLFCLWGFPTTVWQLFLLRLFMGMVAGFIPMSQALSFHSRHQKKIPKSIRYATDRKYYPGALMGPMLGGMLADRFGFHQTFQWVSITIFLLSALLRIIRNLKNVRDGAYERRPEIIRSLFNERGHSVYFPASGPVNRTIVIHFYSNCPFQHPADFIVVCPGNSRDRRILLSFAGCRLFLPPD